MVDKDVIIRALEKRGSVTEIPDITAHINAMDCFDGIYWEPQLLLEVGDEVWGIEVLLTADLRQRQLEAMQAAQDRCDRFRSALVVQNAEDAPEVIVKCQPYGLAVIYPVGDSYWLQDARPSLPPAPPPPEAPCRIPPTLADRAAQLSNIDSAFASALAEFADAHRTARHGGTMSDDHEAALLKRTFERLLQSDHRYVAGYTPLDMLQKLEYWSRDGGFRDHYFHTFHNFLLGVAVINDAYHHFRECLREIMPSSGDQTSVEYIWLLAALFHDVGRTVQRFDDIATLVYGASSWGPEPDTFHGPDTPAAERQDRWDADTYQTVRRQLVSFYEHLTQSNITQDWLPEAFPTTSFAHHPLDRAAAQNFIFDGHGTASALRLGVDIGQRIYGLADVALRCFLTRHLFLAAVSIPFHDRRFREFARKEGISSINTRRFPFAALLAFIDSIQDDRREPRPADNSLDILQDLCVEGEVVKAQINTAALPPDMLPGKQVEARDLQDFLDTSGGLAYEYPKEYLGETGD
jgi:hypothetical protein